MFLFVAFLLALKKAATHAHFISLISTILCLFFARQYVYPHGVGITITTFIAAFTIPPYGMMDTNSFKPDAGVNTPETTTEIVSDIGNAKGKKSKSKENKKTK